MTNYFSNATAQKKYLGICLWAKADLQLTQCCYNCPRDIEILGWCPAGSVVPHEVGHPSSDVITIEIPYRVDALLHRPASHPNVFYWIG